MNELESEEKMNEFESDESSLRTLQFISNDPVGIDSVPHQLVKKCMQEGFVFNILLIGETGIGKSTVASSLFNVPCGVPSGTHMHSEVNLKSHTYDLHEKEVNLKLTIVETTGYGDQINRRDSVKPIIKYIESQFEMYLKEELSMKRSLPIYQDTRIHACLYFICPTGHCLKAIDVYCMKQLHDKVNLIPILAKADSFSKEDLRRFKLAIKNAMEDQGIKIYRFPTEDEEIADLNSKSNDLVPFAIAASGDYVKVNDKLRRARTFPWGTMIVEDEEHSEFLVLRQALIETNMEDMIEKTHSEYFQNFRIIRMDQLGYTETGPITYQELIEKQRNKFRQEMQEKEDKLNQKYVEKMRMKDAELKTMEDAMRSKYNNLFKQLKEEEDIIKYSRNKLELEIRDYKIKKGKEMRNK